MYRVYISSIIQEFEEQYRPAVRDAVLELEMFPVLEEIFGRTPSSHQLQELIYYKLNTCDVFIGIYGMTYGWLPENSQVSGLELEYEYARKRGIPRLIFMTNKDVVGTQPGREYLEQAEAQARMERFRTRLLQDQVGGFFSNPYELKAKVFSALDAYLVRQPFRTVAKPLFDKPLAHAQLQCDAFMIMPFKLANIFENHIQAVVASKGQVIKRGDFPRSGMDIMTEIWTMIYNARYVIADCTEFNPNVMYELGLAETLGRPAILIAEKSSIQDLPFDLRGRRFLGYEYTVEGMKVFEQELAATIDHLQA